MRWGGHGFNPKTIGFEDIIPFSEYLNCEKNDK